MRKALSKREICNCNENSLAYWLLYWLAESFPHVWLYSTNAFTRTPHKYVYIHLSPIVTSVQTTSMIQVYDV